MPEHFADSESELPMFVLDVLQFGMQPLRHVMLLLADTTGVGWRPYWPHDFTESEVIAALRALIASGDVIVWSFDRVGNLVKDESITADSRLEEAWFERTDAGRQRAEAWEPPEPPRILNK